jgi:hypothetical protein
MVRPADFQTQKAALLALLRELSYEERPVTLSSGQPSHFYIDCKQTVLTGEGHILVGACSAPSTCIPGPGSCTMRPSAA